MASQNVETKMPRNSGSLNYGFITIAYGDSKYIRMGKILARSIRLNSPDAKLAVVTDCDDEEINTLFDHVITINLDWPSGVAQKLYLDQYTPFDESIFIDSDCIVYKNLDLIWDYYSQLCDFGIKGYSYLTAEDRHYSIEDLAACLQQLNLRRMASFNSGVIYFNKSQNAQDVFASARDIYHQREDLTLMEFKNAPVNDEPIFALAMEIHNVEILPWDNACVMGTYSGDVKYKNQINVLKKKGQYIKNNVLLDPMIIHFHFECQDYFIFYLEARRLQYKDSVFVRPLAYSHAALDICINRCQYYIKRIKTRTKQYGLLGIIPERISRNFNKPVN